MSNNICRFSDCQKIFKHYKSNSGRYVRHILQLQQLFIRAHIFVDFCRDTQLYITFSNHFEAPCEGSEPNLESDLIDLHCNDKLRSEVKESGLLKRQISESATEGSCLCTPVRDHFHLGRSFLIHEVIQTCKTAPIDRWISPSILRLTTSVTTYS